MTCECQCANACVNYSLEEQATGLFWIDGKEIYQKTFYIPKLTLNTQVPHGIDGVGRVISCYGTGLRTDGYFISAQHPVSGNAKCAVMLLVDQTNVWLHTNALHSIRTSDFYVTIQYTRAVSC